MRHVIANIGRSLTPAARWRLGGVVALTALGSAFQAASPLALKAAVDALGGGAAMVAVIAALVYAGLLGAARIAATLTHYGYSRLTRRIERALSEQAYARLVDLPHAFFLRHRAGETARIVADGVTGVTTVQAAVIFSAVPFIVEIGTVLTVLAAGAFPISLILALVLFVAAYGVTFERGIAGQRTAYREGARTNAEAVGTAQDALLNHEAVKLFGRERHVLAQVAAGMARSDIHWFRYARLVLTTGLLQALIVALALGCTLLLAVREVTAGRLTPGDFVLIGAYVLQVLGPVERLGHLARELARGLDLAGRLRQVLAEPTERDLAPGRAALPGTGALAVRIRQLGFGYGDKREVLRGIDLDIPPGRSLAVVGRSGSGKSTLARLLFRLYPATAGSIALDGIDIETLDPASLRDAIAVVPQETVLFHDTLLSNIAFGRPDASPAEIEEAARIAGLESVIAALPDGWQTLVGERGLRLSGGERQRVAIARAVLKRPRLLVLDEATASLDTRTERAIQAQLDVLAQGVTTLVIAHRLSTVSSADEIVVLENGLVAERGDHATLLRAGGRYAALWSAQEENRDAVSAPLRS
ncbi:ATP-binding cassette domain-containing protein [Plastoroseomonas hellenica]|uniref:ATP-binding cassette domain-containing protein n=1 Tax=Plastoroseomonas hellenica TaxID=2687306 RepID=UPI001BAB15C3|nr:ABC transporter ATP-binding protein [Plastoroseomonas hellenica]MBR0647074.1 ABC transporter ATP-binding protein [Plastoroseomonas hellenica]